MEKFIEILKIIIEKHFFPTIISFVCAMMTYRFTPDTNITLLKFDKKPYIAFWWCVFFLLTEFAIWIYKSLKKYNINKKYSYLEEEKNAKIVREKLEELWTTIDRFTPSDKKIIYHFLKSNNSSDIINIPMSSELIERNFLFSSTIQDGEKWILKYRLRDDIYTLLKISQERFGRISHFD